ncbi:cytochrome c peroxidase [Pseudoalteromonas sp. T1lg65]|uniref:cytochrome c peroxidase n=1 Tax=Pseudoalteromonas sp. T1lg65 TaxID=2077101 RepID=UPI003F7A00E4
MKRTLVGVTVAIGFATQALAIPIPDNVDDELTKLIEQHGLTGDPTQGVQIPDVSNPEVQLGKLLFFSKALSGNKDVACASCHHPYLGGGDGLSLAVGTLAEDEDILGPGRKTITGEFYVPRNTPTIFNAWVYKRGLFRDARVEFLDWLSPEKGISTPDVPYGEADPKAGDSLLAAQARFPVITASEMRGFEFMKGQSNEAVRAHLAARIGDYGDAQGELFKNQWREKFEAVYGNSGTDEVVTFANITKAIAAYQQSMNFSDNPWNRYVKGDKSAISESQKRGAYLYLHMPPPPSDGGGPPDYLPTQCIGCHNTDTFTQTKGSNYHRLAFPQIGPGTGTPGNETNDLGRTHRNGSDADLFSFRSGTLLNIEVTGPFGHAGSYDTLEEVMEHYDDYHPMLTEYIEGKGWCEQPQFKALENCQSLFPDTRYNTDQAAKIVDDEIADGAPVLQPLGLSEQSKADLVNFMKALTDPCVKDAACLKAWIPQPNEGDPDRLQLRAKNYQGVPLYLPANCREGDTLTSSSKLNPDQGECISGKAHYLFFDVEQDNTIVYVSTREGRGKLKLYYHPEQWATRANAMANSTGTGSEQVLKITANKGRHYVSAIGQGEYQGVSIAYGQQSALLELGEKPLAITDQCQTQAPIGYSELKSGEAVCTIAGDGYYYVNVTKPNSTLEIRTRHGRGDTNIYTAALWPTRQYHQFASTRDGNDEYLKVENPPIGWYFILAAGDGANQGVSIQVNLSTKE